MELLTLFAAEEASSGGGLSALGLNLQSFLFQLITFVIVLVILRKFIYRRIVDTLESRRQAVLDSLEDAKKAAAQLENTQDDTKKLLDLAKQEAATIVETARKESASLIEDAETKAAKRADHLVANAKQQLDQEVQAARQTLRKETLELVAQATAVVLGEKVDSKADKELIAKAIKAGQND